MTMPASPPRRIGLTGGIATGKTTVSRYLAEVYQFPLLDADLYAREAVQPGSPILERIFARWGDRLRLENGCLNRKALGSIVFEDQQERSWLESQIHPFVRSRLQEDLIELADKTLVLAIPLLFEAKMTDLATDIWVVTCSTAQQIQRLQGRDGLTEVEALARINSQWPLAEKMAASTVILDNSGSLEWLFRQIDEALLGV
ncbi:MAG: dephospho-CoA kinase [Chloroflexaceae bacterium]|nr:dephospho-CoA kinase [Chloroflexaceae bacterium]